ncbi:hypothetical protein Q4567_20390 [Aliiglaciecola sp. 2_MG-2023]|uniref:hypothetical protein n=1 Tax=unclassified Aliiglaciecola TaxID=2593648 RepID=UPI0026E43707|nr:MULTISPECIES: hypothetical protein [unclassified Aliiglaciecola]MDO6713107.1 hypothetical protein [Aliiglaciecola sp. 2_MG-2023]MDO6754127.1 hypothetical protein [Aliiglaciecola sp. 1_MG-2023]
MDILSEAGNYRKELIGLTAVLIFPMLFIVLSKLIKWAKRNSKGAFVFLAIFPLISLFPIPPSATESLDKQKREQIKRGEESGDPPDDMNVDHQEQ